MNDQFIKGTNDNVIYCTSVCNNRCIMCCQPPKADDSAYHYNKNMKLIQNSPSDIDYVCITGGEPTLSGEYLFEYMSKIWDKMPECSIHLLSNGRLFADTSFLELFDKNVKGKICIGIPLHSDNYIDHDYIAGCRGAFFETIKGLHNLGILKYEIELRVILLKQNINRLPQMAQFIIKNLPFVSQVSFMGLEIIGKAEKSYDKINVEPNEYYHLLNKAIIALESCGIYTRLFNIPLCLLPKNLWKYCCKSISEWKKTNIIKCKECRQIENCCGIFATSKIVSKNISPIITD